MPEISDERIKKLVDRTIAWANDLSEVWTNTTTGNILDARIQHVNELVKSNDLNLALIATNDLAELCQEVEADGH